MCSDMYIVHCSIICYIDMLATLFIHLHIYVALYSLLFQEFGMHTSEVLKTHLYVQESVLMVHCIPLLSTLLSTLSMFKNEC